MKTYLPTEQYFFDKAYLIVQGGSYGIVFSLFSSDNKQYKVFSAESGYIWDGYEKDTLDEILKKAHYGHSAKIFIFDSMKELLEYVLKN